LPDEVKKIKSSEIIGVKSTAAKKCPQKPILVFLPKTPAIADQIRYAIKKAGEANMCAKKINILR